MEKAIFAAGCFWGIELKFSQLPGVLNTRVGYCNGHTEAPTYEEVCTDTTGHAEVVEIEFNPQKISYSELVRFFFTIHDPTQLNRQGPDRGTQYRTAIFTCHIQQAEIAERIREELQKNFKDKIVTEIAPAGIFWPAEEYHQKYLKKRGMGTCSI